MFAIRPCSRTPRHGRAAPAARTVGALVLLGCGTLIAPLAPLRGAEPQNPAAVHAKSSATDNRPQTPPAKLDPAAAYAVLPNWARQPKGARRAAVPSIAIDAEGNVWVYTRANPVVQVYAPDGRYLRGWNEEQPKSVPHAIAFDAEGNVWLVDSGLHVVTKNTPEGKRLLTLGVAGETGNDERHFNRPTGIAFTPEGEIFISDGYGNSRVVHFDRSGKFIKAWGSFGTEPGQLSLPHSIVSDSKGRLYVADRNNDRIQVFDAEGKLLQVWADLMVPWTLQMTSNDELWACGSSPMPRSVHPKYPTASHGCPPKDQIVLKLDTSGKVLERHTFPKGEDDKERPGDLNWLHGIAVDAAQNLYAGDIIGRRVQKFVRKQP